MPTYTLRPNASIATTGPSWDRFGGTTNHGVLSDQNNNTGITAPGTSERTMTLGLANATGTIPGSEVITSVTPYMVMFDSRSNLNTSSTFNAKIGIFSPGYALSEGATYVSRSGNYVTIKGPTSTTVPSRPDTPWSHAELDALNQHIRSQDATNYYEAYIVVETILSGTVDVTAPTGTTTDRGPVVVWSYSIGQQYQGQAQVKVFSAAQYGAGGFDPWTATATASALVTDQANTWDIYFDPGGGQAARGERLADGTYRAYVWVQQINTANWYGPDFSEFTISDPVSVPTSLTPSTGSTVATGTPTLTAAMSAQASGTLKKAEFEVASDSNFANNLLSLQTGQVASGTVSATVPVGSKLAQGLWYVRVRAIDAFNSNSAWSSANSFTVAHKPSPSNLTPSGGTASLYTGTRVLSWTFTDPSATDSQSAFQVQVGKDGNSTPTVDSGTVASAANSYTATLDATHKNIPLWWRVRVRDEDSVWSDWSPFASFVLPEAITATITSPADGGTVNTPSPTITWSLTASGGRTQSAWRAWIVDTSTSAIVDDSGYTVGTATSWTPSLPVVDLGITYTANINLRDNYNIAGTDSNSFTASYSRPASTPFTITSSTYAVDGMVLLSWPTATADANFVSWRVYRRPTGGNWKLIREITPASTRTWADYTAPSNTALEYAVVQAATRFSIVVESPFQPQSFQGDNENYMLVCPDDPSLNVTLYSVRGESFADEIELSTINVIGRGRVVQYGTQYGISGSLEVAFYDNSVATAREQRLALKALRDSGMFCFLRNPFGDVFSVSVISTDITRIPGVGNREFATATINYSEVVEER